MIQRIQSIYLFLAAAAMGSSIFFPLATASGEATALAATGDNFFADGIYWAKEFPGWRGLFFLIIGAVLTIFLYKNRPRQMQLAGGIAFVAVLLLVMFAALGYYYAERLPEGADAHLALGSAFPPIAVPLLILAYRAIKKDEELVRSSDRLR
ncbi:MAG: DUF4293 domain-containing protein [Saprospiraceae bacterium]|nr:DUF4293 domain-containing protein [Saprospiraceae bacterium]